MYYPQFANLGLREILSKSWEVFKARYIPLLFFSGLYSVFSILFSLSMQFLSDPQNTAKLAWFPIERNILLRIIDLSLHILLFLLSLVSSMGTAIIADDYFTGRKMTMGMIVSKSITVLPKAVGILIRFFVTVIGITLAVWIISKITFEVSFILVYVINFWFSIPYFFSYNIAALREKDVSASMKLGKAIIKGNWWESFWNIVFLGIVAFLPMYCLFFCYQFTGLDKTQLPNFYWFYWSIAGSQYLFVGLTLIFLKFESRYYISHQDQRTMEDYRVELRDRIARANAAEMGLEEIAPPSNGQDEGQDDTEGDSVKL